MRSFSRFLLFAKQMGELYAEALRGASREVDLSKQEAEVLLFLANNPQLDTASDVAKYRGFSRAYVSKAVEGLLARGLIEIRVSREDRRVQRLLIPPGAQGAAARLQTAQRAFFARLSAGISHRELSACASVLEKLMQNAEGIAAPCANGDARRAPY